MGFNSAFKGLAANGNLWTVPLLQSVSDIHATRTRKTLNLSSFEQNAARSKVAQKSPQTGHVGSLTNSKQQLIYTRTVQLTQPNMFLTWNILPHPYTLHHRKLRILLFAFVYQNPDK